MLEKIFLLYVENSVTCSIIALLFSRSLTSRICRTALDLINKIVDFLKGRRAKKTASTSKKDQTPREVFSHQTKFILWALLCIPLFLPLHAQFPRAIQDAPAASNVVVRFITDKRQFQARLIADYTFSAGRFEIPVVTVLAYIWILGIAVAFLHCFFMQSQTKKQTIYYGKIVTKGKRWEIFNMVKQEYNITRHIRLIEFQGLASPCIKGIWKIIVFVPKEECSDAMFEMMIRHELSHYRRMDLYSSLFTLAISSLHWFNPVVYAMIDCMGQDEECACDADALEGKNSSERASYRNEFILFLEKERRCWKEAHSLYLHGSHRMGRVEERLYSIDHPMARTTGKRYLYVASFFVLCSFFRLASDDTSTVANALLDIPSVSGIRVDSHDVQDQAIKSEPHEEPLDVAEEMVFPVENPTGVVRPYRFVKLKDRVMNGLIFYAPYGTEVHAPISGEIIYAGFEPNDGAGNTIVVKNENSIVAIRHLLSIDHLIGTKVKQNEVIGQIGTSGRAEAPMCEIILTDNNDNPIDLSMITAIFEKVL